MPIPRLNDARLRTIATRLNAEPSARITDANVVDILAAVGDSNRISAQRLAAELSKPGMTRQQQFDKASAGLSANEKRDLSAMLDAAAPRMDAGARNFLEALVGRAPLQTSFGPLVIVGNQRQGISGQAKAGDIIEAINLSAAPAGRLHLTDTMEIARAGADGRFTGILPGVKEGDVVRMRTRSADGTTSDWLTINATGVEASDTRNALVNLERIDLAATAAGEITFTHNTKRPLTEPGAKLRFTNTRTGQKIDVTATADGSIPPGLKLPGRAGDSVSVAVSDSKNNASLQAVAGSLTVPGAGGGSTGVNLPDAAPHKDDLGLDGTPRFKLTRFTGPLFLNEPTMEDVRQGAIGNCYFPAALAAIAYAQPAALKDIVKQNLDGTYTVKFKESWSRREVSITVDGDLYTRSFGGPVYGSSLGGSTAPDKMEMWYPIIEKAYAQWKGSYDSIGNGGHSASVMSEMLGKSYKSYSVSSSQKDRLFDQIKAGATRKAPMTAGTYGTDQAARYTNTRVYANHAYSVLGAVEENGQKYIQLRNPWGQSEYGNDGKDDGIFKVPLETFAQLYQNLAILDS